MKREKKMKAVSASGASSWSCEYRRHHFKQKQPSSLLTWQSPRDYHHHHQFSSVVLKFSPRESSTLRCINPTREQRRRLAVGCSTSASSFVVRDSPAKELRRILDSPGVHQGPACFDALSAKLVQNAGFQFCFSTGFGIAATSLGLSDTGYVSYGEMVDQGQKITQAVSIPVIGDGDNGYGNAMNVKRTVKGFIRAGFAGIILEDQVAPKACGHTRGRKVVSREEAVMRINAAVDARRESGSDIVIVARTDSRQAVSFEESLWRSRAFADAGADVLFIDALSSKEEMKNFCQISPLVPKMANMLEGGGKTPILSPIELEELGYKIVAYPLSLLGVSMQAMQDALTAIKGGRLPAPGSMPSFEEMKETLGFNTYYEEEKRYAISPKNSAYWSSIRDPYDNSDQQQPQNTQDFITEAIIPYVYTGNKDPFSGIWSRTLRINVTGRDGLEKLDLRIPAGFLDRITDIIPALGGVNIKELLSNASDEMGGKVLLDFKDRMGDRIMVFLE